MTGGQTDLWSVTSQVFNYMFKKKKVNPEPRLTRSTCTSTSRHCLQTKHILTVKNTQPPPPRLNLWPTLQCPPVWPERTQMEDQSVLAAPHINCTEMSGSFRATDGAEPKQHRIKNGPDTVRCQRTLDQVCRSMSPVFHLHNCVCYTCIYVYECVMCWRPRWTNRGAASQVCVLQLVLWIRPMTNTSENPAISQHQGGTAPLTTRARATARDTARTQPEIYT